MLFEEKAWESNPEAKLLRATPELIVPMYVAPHDELHTNIPFVPLLDSIQVFHVRREFQPKDTPLKNISELIRCIVRSTERFDRNDQNNLNSSLRISMAELVVIALEGQIPFIREGLCRQALPPKQKRTKIDRRRGGHVC